MLIPAAERAADDDAANVPPPQAALGACCWLDEACERLAICDSSNQCIRVVRVSDGRVLHSRASGRVVDLAAAPAAGRLVVATQQMQLLVYNIAALGDPSAVPSVIQVSFHFSFKS